MTILERAVAFISRGKQVHTDILPNDSLDDFINENSAKTQIFLFIYARRLLKERWKWRTWWNCCIQLETTRWCKLYIFYFSNCGCIATIRRNFFLAALAHLRKLSCAMQFVIRSRSSFDTSLSHISIANKIVRNKVTGSFIIALQYNIQ